MKRLFALLPVLLTLACQRPEVEAFKHQPTPIVVDCYVPKSVAAREDLGREYAAALRARLAAYTVVVPEGVRPPVHAAELRVKITGWSRERGPSPGAVGAVTGVAVGTLSALLGNRDAVYDGVFWGMWAGTHAAADREREERLGYRPTRLSAQVALYRAGDPEPLDAYAVESPEIYDAMEALSSADREDPYRIQEEEAKAFARVAVKKLVQTFGWMPLPKPAWYGVQERPQPLDEPTTPEH